MAKPSEKTEAMEQALKGMVGFDRREYIRQDKCVPQPYGCGGTARVFRDELSVKEYQMSGMCQNCQDSVFGVSDED